MNREYLAPVGAILYTVSVVNKGSRKIGFWLVSGIDRAPLALIVGLSVLGLWLIILLLFEQFSTLLVWLPGSVLFLASTIVTLAVLRKVDKTPVSRAQAIWDGAVVAFIIAWSGFNMFYASQHVLTNRDPATYTNMASWLSKRESVLIPEGKTLSDRQGLIRQDSMGFNTDVAELTGQRVVFAQGQHVVPALLGAAGKFVGEKQVLRLNVVFGATALLAIYAFARLFLRRHWAATVMGVMAASYPLLYFSRDVYTEPLTATFIFGGLALLALAYRRKSTWLWLLAGMVSGASLLARVDAYLGIVGITGFIIWYTVFSTNDSYRRRLLNSGLFLLAILVHAMVAWLDIYLLSYPYFVGTKSLIVKEVVVFVAVLIGGIIANLLLVKWPRIKRWLIYKTRWIKSKWVAISIVLVGIIIASRPLWFMGYETLAGQPSRTYSEFTSYWIGWYVGDLVVVAALLGIAVAVYRITHGKQLALLPILMALTAMICVYFMIPSVAPDQVWASRRMLPLIMPGLVFMGVYFISEARDNIRLPKQVPGWLATGLIVMALLLPPLVASKPFLRVSATKQYAFVDTCTKLPTRSVVVWLGTGGLQAVQPTRTYCDTEAYKISTEIPRFVTANQNVWSSLAKEAQQSNKTLIVGVYTNTDKGSQAPAFLTERQMSALSQTAAIRTEQPDDPRTYRPTRNTSLVVDISLARVNLDGSFAKLSTP